MISKSAKKLIDKLEFKKEAFGNPTKIVIDKVKVFTESEFKTYCTKQGIEHLKLALG